MTVAFPILWYALLTGSGFIVYMYYIQSRELFVQYDHQTVSSAVLITCSIYLISEFLQCLFLKLLARDIQLHYTQEEANEHAFVIIAAHKASASLATMLPTVLQNFASSQVYVADNGLERDCDTERLCEEYGINYCYYNIANKTWALYQTARSIYKRYGDEAKALVLLDDDTELPPSFFVRLDLLQTPMVAGYCPGISVKRTPPSNVWEHMVDFEYRTISYHNEGKARYSTLPFLHGVCAVYNIECMLFIFAKLCTMPHGLPFGEDSYAGVDCRMAGYRLLQDNMNVVSTYCPRRLFPPVCTSSETRQQGFGASSLWKQRVMRWYLSWPRRLPSELALAIFYDTGTWVGNLRYRFDMIWNVFLMLVASVWPLYVVSMIVHGKRCFDFVYLHIGLAATAIGIAGFRYSMFPAKLKQDVHMKTILMKPLMNAIVCVMMSASFFVSMLWYIPFHHLDYDRCYALSTGWG
jgi:nitrate reductase NapE component